MRQWCVTGVLLLLVAVASSAVGEGIEDIRWTLGPDFPALRKGGALGVVGGKVISACGMEQPWCEAKTAYLLDPLNPLTTTLGVTNVSFVAQVVEWIPELLYEVLQAGFRHKGFSFIRILQRCPHFMQDIYTKLMTDPANVMLLTHENGMPISDGIARLYKTQEEHDPRDLQRARELSAMQDKVPIGILYQNPDVPTYDDLRSPERAPTIEQRQDLLESAFDKFGIFPTSNIEVITGGNGDGSGGSK